ncbi:MULTISPECIES: sodium-independent anion transporter [unclassified Lysinibacillus]|uniref:sodium-independent anion transporter n=1 Tax=unclassified Lysinibacillus TaxID=2636778 RepID=UPI001F108F68|nr:MULTISPECIES: sodium-independent anion transporter [unclassified Lysinibacillus]
MYTIEGPLFFGAAQTFEQSILNTIHYRPRVLILRMGKVPFIDTTGEEYFRNIVRSFTKQGGIVLVSGVQPSLKSMLDANGLTEVIGQKEMRDLEK